MCVIGAIIDHWLQSSRVVHISYGLMPIQWFLCGRREKIKFRTKRHSRLELICFDSIFMELSIYFTFHLHGRSDHDQSHCEWTCITNPHVKGNPCYSGILKNIILSDQPEQLHKATSSMKKLYCSCDNLHIVIHQIRSDGSDKLFVVVNNQ